MDASKIAVTINNPEVRKVEGTSNGKKWEFFAQRCRYALEGFNFSIDRTTTTEQAALPPGRYLVDRSQFVPHKYGDRLMLVRDAMFEPADEGTRYAAE